jgi:hypothetical protein
MLMLIVMHMCIGIFRLTGAKLDVLSLYGRLMIDQQSSMAMSPLVAERDIHVVATVTKALLRRLPETLLTSSLYSTIMAAPLLTPSSAAILALRNAIGALPPDNRGVLQSLITCCCQLVSNTSTTKMEAGNLAVVVGAAFLPNDDPSLLIGVKNSMSPLFYYFIHHYESIFGVAPPCGPIAPLDNATVTALLAAATNAASSRASAPLLPSASFTYGPKHSHSLPSSFSLSSISPPTGAVTATGSGVTATTSGSGHQTSPSLGSLGATNTAFSQSFAGAPSRRPAPPPPTGSHRRSTAPNFQTPAVLGNSDAHVNGAASSISVSSAAAAAGGTPSKTSASSPSSQNSIVGLVGASSVPLAVTKRPRRPLSSSIWPYLLVIIGIIAYLVMYPLKNPLMNIPPLLLCMLLLYGLQPIRRFTYRHLPTLPYYSLFRGHAPLLCRDGIHHIQAQLAMLPYGPVSCLLYGNQAWVIVSSPEAIADLTQRNFKRTQ